MALYIANCVTTILDLKARVVDNLTQRYEIIKGNVIGPRIALVTLINGGNSSVRIVNTPEDVRQTVRLVKAFNQAGIPIVSGTDAGSSGVIWGYSLHDEIENLTLAGLTNE